MPKAPQAPLSLLQALIAKPDARHYGADLLVSGGVAIADLYPTLDRLKDAGFLLSGWDLDGKRPRKYYLLTARGRETLPLEVSFHS